MLCISRVAGAARDGVSFSYKIKKCVLTHLDHTHTASMRLVDLSRNNIIKAGMPWAFSGSPNSKNMIEHLERNESVVTWLEVSMINWKFHFFYF